MSHKLTSAELRRGNCIYQGEGIVKFVNHRIISWIESNPDTHDYTPILLTPELLEKCKFGNNTIINNKTISKNLVRDGSGNYEGYLQDFRMGQIVRFYYLHQLQNLYYTLTGTELEINNLINS